MTDVPRARSPVVTSRALLGRASFRWFLVAECAGTAGYAVYSLAIVWIAAGPGGSLGVAGLALALEFGIYSLSFLVGPFVDQARSPLRIAVVGYALQATFAVGLGLLATRGAVPVPILLGSVAALSIAWDFSWTAQNALLPRLVAENDLFPATGILGAVGGVVQVGGTAAAAVLLSVGGGPAALALYGALNVVGCVAFVPIGVAAVAAPARSAAVRFGAALVDGWRYLLHGSGRPLLGLSLFGVFEGVATAAPSLLIVLDAGGPGTTVAATYGAYGTALAVGAVLGSLLLGAANPRRRLGAWLLGATAVEGGLFALVPLAGGSVPASAAVWLGLGLIEVIPFSGIFVYLQATTPTELQGRTYTNSYLFRGAGRTSGSLLLGAVAVGLGLATTSYALAAYLLVVVAGTALVTPTLRRLAF